MADTNDKALVLFSGGQDSTVCLAWALARYDHVETIGFTYGQRHAVELDCRKRVLREIRAVFTEWSEHLGPDHVLDLPTLGELSETALTRDVEIEIADSGLPTTFVPGPQSAVFRLCRGSRLSTGHSDAGRRHVRDRLFGLPGLPGRDIAVAGQVHFAGHRCHL